MAQIKIEGLGLIEIAGEVILISENPSGVSFLTEIKDTDKKALLLNYTKK